MKKERGDFFMLETYDLACSTGELLEHLHTIHCEIAEKFDFEEYGKVKIPKLKPLASVIDIYRLVCILDALLQDSQLQEICNNIIYENEHGGNINDD